LAAMLESHGASRMLANFHDALPGWVLAGLFFSDKYLTEHGDKVKAFLRALDKSYEFIKSSEKKAREYLPKYTGLPLDVCMISAIREYGSPIEPMEKLLHFRDLMMAHGYLKTPVTLDDILDYRYLPQK